MINKMKDKIILTTIDVMMEKWKETFPFLKLISPGSFPMNVQIIPMIRKMISSRINNFPIFIRAHLLSVQNVYKIFVLQLFSLVFAGYNQFVLNIVHIHLH